MSASFIRNAWYVAASSGEVGREPFRRTLLGEPVVLFRKLDGSPVALRDRCAHRFAPLSRGRLEGDRIRCAYHGLAYDASGACVANPHGDHVPAQAHVRAFALLERYGFIWLWGGDAQDADAALLPDLAPFDESAGWVRQGGYLRVQAHYQLIVDNLLDLSHVEYLHPSFASRDAIENTRHEVFESGNAVHSNRYKPACHISPLLNRCWSREGAVGDARSCIRWHAPATLFLEIGATEVGAPESAGVTLPILHLLSPETLLSTHYFWAVQRDRRLQDRELDAWMDRTLGEAFVGEDEPMIEAQQEQLGGEIDINALGPVFLPPDLAPIKARRIISRLLAAELPTPTSTLQRGMP